jgi:hypothetical protein
MNARRIHPVPRRAALAAAALVLLAAPARLHASSPCSLGFLLKSAPTIDGANSGDWADASIATSAGGGTGCVSRLYDGDMLPYDVTVFTKRYLRNGQLFLGFLFEVHDATKDAGGGLLTNGERLAIVFDGDHSGGAQLAPADARLTVTHRWESSGGDPNLVTNVQTAWSTGTMAAGICGGGPRWQSVALPAGVSVAVRKDFPGGYREELEVPAAALGGVGADFGVAFQVINDWGTSGNPNSAGNSFPASLPYNTTDNAVDGCNTGWRVPADWGTGFFAGAPGDVTISRLPVFWQSPDVIPFACAGASYNYYPANPCRLTVQGTVHSTFTSAQTRNLLYVWADHGAAPVVWRVIGLKKGVSIPAGGSVTQASDLWTAVPLNLPNHPCVRVYILPPVFQAAFDEAAILAISNATQLAQMESVYGVQAQHWAQKNITAFAAGTICPDASCRVAFGEGGGERWAFAPRLRSPFGVPALAAQRQEGGGDSTHTPIFLPPVDRKLLGTDNVLVQVREFGYAAPGPADSLKYVLAENLGGLLQAVPVKLFDEKQQQWPIVFTVGNPGNVPRTVLLTTETEVPAGHAAVNVAVDFPRTRFDRNEQREMKGTVGPAHTGGGGTTGGGKCGLGKGRLGLVAALLGLALVGLGRRSWTRG